MKRLLILLLFISSLGFSQSSGITYQAVIYNPAGEELPGVDNPYAPLTNQNVCLQFGIIDADGNVEYQEEVQVTTDAFGMVNLLIGTNTQTGGSAADFAGVEWSADAKFLKVDLDIRGSCSNFEQLSNQPFTYVPFAYYSPASDTPGPEGPVGPAGADGQDGIDGQDGATGPAGSTGQAGPAGPNGQDGATGPSGPQGEQGPAGENGEDGSDGEGLNSLISSTVEEAGENCENGGIKIQTGIDTNSNGTLDESEVDQDNTQYICNGTDGEGGSGIGNFTGEDLVPEEVITMQGFDLGSPGTSSFTVPIGKYAKISAILGDALGSSQIYPGFGDFKLVVDGVDTFIGGSGGGGVTGNDEQMFSDALYFPQETFLEISEYGVIVFLEIYSLNNFIPKIITELDIVPEGKKWRVCNILASESVTIGNSNSAIGNEILINGTRILANGGNIGSFGWDIVSFANSSFWIPEGTSLAPATHTYAVNVLEFDSSQSSTGGGSDDGISSVNNSTLQMAGVGDYKWDVPGWEFDSFSSGINSNTYITNNKIFYYPISIKSQKEFSSLGFFPDSNWQDLPEISIRIGIFSFEAGLPGDLIYDFSLNTYQAWFNEFDLDFSLEAGSYYVGVTSESQGLNSYIQLKYPLRFANNSTVRAISSHGSVKRLSGTGSITDVTSGNTYVFSKDPGQIGFGDLNINDFIEMTYGGYILFKEN